MNNLTILSGLTLLEGPELSHDGPVMGRTHLDQDCFPLALHLNLSLLSVAKRQSWGLLSPFICPPPAMGTLGQSLFSSSHHPLPLQCMGTSVFLVTLQSCSCHCHNWDLCQRIKDKWTHTFKVNTTILESWNGTICGVGHRAHDGFACKLGWQNSHHSLLQCLCFCSELRESNGFFF